MAFKDVMGGIGGLLSDPEKQMALLNNPMFSAGMGLLSSSYDRDINPYQAMMGGLMQAKQSQSEQAEEERMAKLRERLAALIRQQQQTQQTQLPGQTQQQPAGALTGTPAPQVQWQSPYAQELWDALGWRDTLGR